MTENHSPLKRSDVNDRKKKTFAINMLQEANGLHLEPVLHKSRLPNMTSMLWFMPSFPSILRKKTLNNVIYCPTLNQNGIAVVWNFHKWPISANISVYVGMHSYCIIATIIQKSNITSYMYLLQWPLIEHFLQYIF